MFDMIMVVLVVLLMQLWCVFILFVIVNFDVCFVDVVFIIGVVVWWWCWMGWDIFVFFDEIFEVSDRVVDLICFNVGVLVFDSYLVWFFYLQVGVVECVWIEGKEGKVIICFLCEGFDQVVDCMFGLISDGIICNVLVGYFIEWVKVVEFVMKGEVE